MGEARRILLVEVTPRIPQATVPATWNPLDKHADVTLSGGNLTATKSTTHASNWACARDTVSIKGGQWYWETTYLFTGTANLSAGLAKAAAPLDVRPGILPYTPDGRLYSVSGPDRNGDCYVAGGPAVNVGAVANGAVVRHWLDFDAPAYRVANAGGSWVTVLEGADLWAALGGEACFPIAAFLRPSLSTCSITANFGASAFTYAPPDGANQGVYSTPDPVATTLYLGSEGFNTEAGDAPASQHYMGRIAGDSDVESEREGSCWVWGGQSISRPGQLAIVNADGALDAWADYLWRDAPITLLRGRAGNARSAFAVHTTGVVDRVEFTAANRVVLTLADTLALLDRATQTELYPDSQANAQAAGQPLPWVLGRPLYCEGVRLNTSPVTRDYQLQDDFTDDDSDAYLTEITAVYDKGDLFAGPDDAYSAHNPITLLNGGAFTTWANDSGGVSMPSGWTRITAFTAADQFVNSVGRLQCVSSGQAQTAMYHNTALQAGRRYTIAFNVAGSGVPGTLTFRLDGPAEGMLDYPFTVTTTGSFSLTIDVPEAANLQIVLGATQLNCIIDNVTCSSVQIIDWTYWTSGARRGFTLANTPAGKVVCNPVGPKISAKIGGGGAGLDAAGDVIETLGPVIRHIIGRAWAVSPPATWSLDDAAISALQAAADYRVAEYVNKPASALGLLRALLDSWCGWIVQTRSGALTVGRVTEPSNTPVLTLTDTSIVELSRATDEAKGLSIRIAGARNHATHTDADIAGSVSDAMRAVLKAEWGVIRTGAPTFSTDAVSPAYLAAVAAPARGTWLQDAMHIQAEANRIATLWRKARAFFDVKVVLDAEDADQLEPGQTVRVVWPRHGLATGKNLLVIGVRSRFFSRRVDLKLWG